jgi:hypothetical protein
MSNPQTPNPFPSNVQVNAQTNDVTGAMVPFNQLGGMQTRQTLNFNTEDMSQVIVNKLEREVRNSIAALRSRLTALEATRTSIATSAEAHYTTLQESVLNPTDTRLPAVLAAFAAFTPAQDPPSWSSSVGLAADYYKAPSPLPKTIYVSYTLVSNYESGSFSASSSIPTPQTLVDTRTQWLENERAIASLNSEINRLRVILSSRDELQRRARSVIAMQVAKTTEEGRAFADAVEKTDVADLLASLTD